MANEIQYLHDDAAETLYVIIRNSSGQFWNTSGTPAFETFEAANWSDYASAMSAVDTSSPPSSGNVMLQGSWPAALLTVGIYWMDFYVRAGALASQTDLLLESVSCYYARGVVYTGIQAHAILHADTYLAVWGSLWDLYEYLTTYGDAHWEANFAIDSTGGGLTLGAAVSQIRSMLVGKAVYDAGTGVASYYDNAGNAVVISTPLLGNGSRNAPTVS